MKQKNSYRSDAVMGVCVCADWCCIIARHLSLTMSIVAAVLNALLHSQLAADAYSQYAWRQRQDCPGIERSEADVHLTDPHLSACLCTAAGLPVPPLAP